MMNDLAIRDADDAAVDAEADARLGIENRPDWLTSANTRMGEIDDNALQRVWLIPTGESAAADGTPEIRGNAVNVVRRGCACNGSASAIADNGNARLRQTQTTARGRTGVGSPRRPATVRKNDIAQQTQSNTTQSTEQSGGI